MLIERLKLTIRKLRHEQFGQSSEGGALLDQLELQLADLEENAAQAETAVRMAAADQITVTSFERRKPARRPLPEHLPRDALSIRCLRSAHAATIAVCARSAKTSPRRWSLFRASGK